MFKILTLGFEVQVSGLRFKVLGFGQLPLWGFPDIGDLNIDRSIV